MSTEPSRGRFVRPVLALAIVAISASAILVRLIPDVHPVTIAFWRTATVAVLLSPFLRRVSARDLALVVGAGACLALHFWAWFASIHHTSVMRSTVLVCLTPIWTGVLEGLLLGHRPGRRFWPGIGLAVGGVMVMIGFTPGQGSLLGDGLATLGGVLSSLYFLVGRSVRQRVQFAAYGAMVCGAAALWLLPVAMLVEAPLVGLPIASWAVIGGIILGPQLIGHVGLNYSIRYVPASLIAALIVLEPVGATALAAFVLGEVPGLREVAGAAIVLIGVFIAAREG
ncbi:MAG: DMT family transporter [Alphaproteobacteria bacterium]|nr:DMT family transporter [Alphaproteobacteria bacterium]